MRIPLTAVNVDTVLRDCLFRADLDDIACLRPVEGIMYLWHFHSERLEQHVSEIRSMLDDLPSQFHEKEGGGWSFLCACNNKNNEQWTGLHETVESLFALGLAVGFVKLCLSREFWCSLPDRLPYYIVLAERATAEGTGALNKMDWDTYTK